MPCACDSFRVVVAFALAASQFPAQAANWPMLGGGPDRAHLSTDALPARTVARQWASAVGGKMEAGPVAADKTIFVAGNDRRLTALDAKKGGVLWRFVAGGAISAEPALADGLVVVATKDGEVT
ncbi:MAG: PQQ-binding-like beta-propeller repeat protein, partial [Sulfurimicrobium sp.]|nr:PQQ-binding-like beta-propeller repeat protein [Sulfurimicrobium sp.]